MSTQERLSAIEAKLVELQKESTQNKAFGISLHLALETAEAKLEEFEEYFDTIESILTKIQAIYEAIKEQGDHDKLL